MKVGIALAPVYSRVPARALTHNQGLSADGGSNRRPFGLQDSAQPTEHTSQGFQYFQRFYKKPSWLFGNSLPLWSLARATPVPAVPGMDPCGTERPPVVLLPLCAF